MAWWTKIRDKFEKHENQMSALIALMFARQMGNQALETLALYRKDPAKNPKEQNVLPEMCRNFEAQRSKRRGRVSTSKRPSPVPKTRQEGC